MVGNDIVAPRPRLKLAVSSITEDLAVQAITPVIMSSEEVIPVSVVPIQLAKQRHLGSRAMDALHSHSFVTFALLFLLVGTSGIYVAGQYWTAKFDKPVVATAKRPTISGMSLTVPASQLQQKLQQITTQSASLTVGSQTVSINPDTIKDWLQITSSDNKAEDYIFVNQGAMAKSLDDIAHKFVSSPVNEVTVSHDGADQVVVTGRNGSQLSDPAGLAAQAKTTAKTLMDAKGLSFTTPLSTQAFQAVTPAAFPKLLEADVTNKILYVYQNGQLINTFLTSDGAPATPTPLGEFHIYAKYAVQDMSGYNANGTKYFQPRVPWVNYFTGGDAIHGVYWHPLSWFGANNSSHGCVGVPVDVGEWIYNWAPIGTTVITHV